MARTFEDGMVRHLREFNPHHCEVIGEAGLREVIRAAIVRAAEYGFTTRGPVRLYLDLIFMFGHDFDTDPLYPWAGEILNHGDGEDQMQRAERLHATALRYADAVAGPNHEFEKAALRRAQSVSWQDLRLPPGSFEDGCVARLREAHTHKYAYVGEDAVRGMIGEAVEKAQAFSISAPEGRLLFVVMAFALGHGFVADPLYPWVSGTLNNPAIKDPNRRAERLCAKAKTYLERVLANVA